MKPRCTEIAIQASNCNYSNPLRGRRERGREGGEETEQKKINKYARNLADTPFARAGPPFVERSRFRFRSREIT